MHAELEIQTSDYQGHDFKNVQRKTLLLRNEYEKFMINANTKFHRLRLRIIIA